MSRYGSDGIRVTDWYDDVDEDGNRYTVYVYDGEEELSFTIDCDSGE